MSGLLPERRSKWWIAVFLVYMAAVFAFFFIVRFLVMKRPVDAAFFSATAVLSLAISFVVCLSGYFNAKLVSIVTTAGVIAGMIMMPVVLARKTGWEDLIGVILFFELTLLGLAGGIVLQVIYFIYKVTTDKSKKNKGK